jgi:hypothetical protein
MVLREKLSFWEGKTPGNGEMPNYEVPLSKGMRAFQRYNFFEATSIMNLHFNMNYRL